MPDVPLPPEIPIDDPRDVAAIRRRLEARSGLRDRDGARVLADVLVSLGEATPRERSLTSALSGPIRPARPLDRAGWAQLAHPELDPVLSVIFEVLWPAVLSIRGKLDREAGIAPKYEIDSGATTIALGRSFGFAAKTLGLAPPRFFLRQDVPGGLVHLPVWPLASLAGSSLLSGFEPPDLLFVCGVHVAWYLGPLYLVTLTPSARELAILLWAGLALAGIVRADASDAVQQAVRALRPKLTPLPLEVLAHAAQRLKVPALSSLEAALLETVTRWRRAAWLTTHRAGLLLSQDAGSAARMIDRLGTAFPGSGIADAQDSLLRFAISRRYVELRARVGADR